MWGSATPPEVRFAKLGPADQAEEIAKTRRVIADLLRQVRGEFPEVRVEFDGQPLPEWVVDEAWTLSRAQLRAARASGRPYDPIAIFAAQLPSAIANDRKRMARMEPPRELHGIGGFHEYQQLRREGLPSAPLLAPLVLTSEDAG